MAASADELQPGGTEGTFFPTRPSSIELRAFRRGVQPESFHVLKADEPAQVCDDLRDNVATGMGFARQQFKVCPDDTMRGSLLPRWVDRIRPLMAVALALGPLYVLGLAYFTGSPETTDVGYTPKQPVPFSHALHAGVMGLDCRYCHTTVESAARAAIPSTDICMNCHTQVATGSEKTQLIRESAENGRPNSVGSSARPARLCLL